MVELGAPLFLNGQCLDKQTNKKSWMSENGQVQELKMSKNAAKEKRWKTFQNVKKWRVVWEFCTVLFNNDFISCAWWMISYFQCTVYRAMHIIQICIIASVVHLQVVVVTW